MLDLNSTSVGLGDCVSSPQTFIAVIMSFLLFISEGMGSTEKSKYNGLLHIFSSQCLKKE